MRGGGYKGLKITFHWVQKNHLGTDKANSGINIYQYIPYSCILSNGKYVQNANEYTGYPI